MIEKLLNQMRAQAQMVISNVALTRMGTIANYNPTTYQVKVFIEPQDTEAPNNTLTGWIPLLSSWVGNGWGMFAPPSIGAACALHFSEGNFGAPFAAQMLFNNTNLPVAVQSGEFWLVHESGSTLKLTNDGNVTLSGNVTVNIDAQNVNIGNLTAGNLQKLLTATAATVYNAHSHPSNGAPPDMLMTSTDMTQYTEAN